MRVDDEDEANAAYKVLAEHVTALGGQLARGLVAGRIEDRTQVARREDELDTPSSLAMCMREDQSHKLRCAMDGAETFVAGPAGESDKRLTS